jgi:transposase-like protein
MKEEKPGCRKKEYQKFDYTLKLKVINEIQNGQISINYASKKYNISRSSITYWLKKFTTLEQKNKNMGKNNEIKRLKEKIEELEFVKEFQQEVLAEVELETGLDIVKKLLPEKLAKEIELKKINLSKRNG